MSSIKSLLIVFLVLQGLTAFSQQAGPILLKWKLKPNEIIVYKTTMQDIDANGNNDALQSVFKRMGDTTADQFKKLLSQLNKEVQNDSMTTTLTEKRRNIIDIAMSLNPKKVATDKDTSKLKGDYQQYQSLINKMSGGIMLRGSIHEDGTIESFYTKSDQRNLIAILFQLPGRAVSVGDSWPLDVHLISVDQNFLCDSSYRRDFATVTGIDHKNGETIVQLKYDIDEYVAGGMESTFNGNKNLITFIKMTYQAVAGFSLERGRWVNYNGVMSMSGTGLMSYNVIKKFELIEK